MADSALTDVTKMKVYDIRKELKSRGLSITGGKAALQARLQAALDSAQDAQDLHDDHGDINLDSDEIDSDGVLEDEDDKSQNDILDDATVDTLNEELALEESSPPKPPPETKPLRILKRKITSDSKATENKDACTKKIVLNRTISLTSNTKPDEEKKEKKAITPPEPDLSVNTSTNKVKITADIDSKTRLEMRAKRFGLPVTMTDEQRKEARKQRFNQNQQAAKSNNILETSNTGSLTDNLEKLKKRAERFGQSVSAIMTDIENKEKLEKRKAKFSTSK